MFEEILKAYGLPPADKIIPINSGLINSTWKVSTSTEDFILQKINQNVFKRPRLFDEKEQSEIKRLPRLILIISAMGPIP